MSIEFSTVNIFMKAKIIICHVLNVLRHFGFKAGWTRDKKFRPFNAYAPQLSEMHALKCKICQFGDID